MKEISTEKAHSEIPFPRESIIFTPQLFVCKSFAAQMFIDRSTELKIYLRDYFSIIAINKN